VRGWSWRHVLYYGAPVWALLLSGAFVSLLLMLTHTGVGDAYHALYQGALGNRYAIGLSLTRAVPLILTGLSVAFAYRCGLFNIGAEGQLQVAGVSAVFVAFETGSAWLALLGAIAAGAVWGGIPGYAKAKLGVNEIISTLMLTFVAVTLVIIFVSGPFKDKSAAYSTSPSVPSSSRLPNILSGTPLHLGFVIALVAVLVVAYVLYWTPLGFRIRAVGLNAGAARHVGINVARTTTVAMLVSGGLAGLGGALDALGVQYRVATDWSPGWGFTGIAVAFLARSNPFATVIVAVLYGGLSAGGENMQFVTGIPGAVLSVVEGLPILFLVAITSRARPMSRRAAVRVPSESAGRR
jgi:simple sugar transport system permease protein